VTGSSAPIAVIANPAAGGGKARRAGEAVVAKLKALGHPAELVLTQARGEATALASELVARRTERIVVAGGDGTVQEVARALAGRDAALGIVPCGRGNDLARVLGIPSDWDAAAEVIARGEVRRIDLGRIAGRHFVTVAAMGFDSEAAAYAHASRLGLPGPLGYLWAVARTLVRFESPEVTLRGDFGEHQGRILLAATGNTSTYGGGMRIAPGAAPDDGLLDVCVVRALPRWTILRAFPRLFAGTHIDLPYVTTLRTRRLEITASRPLAIFADGEPIATTPAEITVDPLALRVLCPGTRTL
jgi:diacylglycerol kinase (ATP)